MNPPHDQLRASALLAAAIACTTGLSEARQFGDHELLQAPSLPPIARTLAFDVDADGDLDLVTSHESGSGVRYTPQVGIGSREFGAATLLGPLPGSLQSFLPGDLDGDGREDLVVVNAVQDVVDVLWTESTGLGAPVRIHSGPRVPFVGVLMDLDLDGDLDVALPRTGSTTLPENFTWIENLGARQFAAPADFVSLDTRATQVLAGDIDGDGDDDLVTYAGQEFIRFYRRDPSGFELVQTLSGLSFSAGVFLQDLIDLDLDGDLDLRVRSNLSTGQLAPFLAPFDGAAGAFAPLGPRPDIHGRSEVLDVDGDSLPDFVFVPGGGAPGEFFPGLGSLQFGASEPLGPASAALDTLIFQADLDTDGFNDLVSYGPFGLAWVAGASVAAGPALEDEARFVTREALNVVGTAAVPLNGDAYLDLVAASSQSGLLRFDGTGFGELSFRGELDADSAEPLDNLQGLDVDGDGARDLLMRSRGHEVSWRRNLGSGAFAAPVPIAQLGNADRMLQAVDVDGDGDLDFVETTPRSTTLTWWEQGPGGALLAPAALLTTVNPIQDASMGDHNGDGVEDLAITILLNGSRFRIRWLQGTGGGQFAAGETLTQLSEAPGRFRSVDLDSDGQAEIAWEDPAPLGRMQVARFIPSAGAFSAAATFSAWGVNDSVFPEDFDGDGQGDLLTVDRGTGPVRFFRGLGGFSFAPAVVAQAYSGPNRSAEVVDFDSDGDLDLIVSSWALGFGGGSASRVFLYRNAAVGTPGEIYCGPAVVNSTGESAVIASRGSAIATEMNLVLRSAVLPPGSTTFFLGSRAADLISQPMGSQGVLCLGGSIGRFVGPGQVLTATMSGTAELVLDLTNLAQPTGGVPAAAGETWYFQGWFRDSVAGQATSNFTDGLALTFL